MRKALVVGINFYQNGGSLYGCVNDAHSVRSALERHSDGSVNFGVKLVTAVDEQTKISRGKLKDMATELFEGDAEIALFYFAGHGHIETTGGYLLASDANRSDDGFPLSELMTIANKSKAKNKIIILDSCHSGIAGDSPSHSMAEISEGLTILTASTKEQYATERNGRGVFTELLVDALSGAAANIVGDITPGSIYSHIDQSLGPWEQRPVFKTNVKKFISLKKAQPSITLQDLQRMIEFFPEAGSEFKLNPTFEPEMKGRDRGMPEPIPANVEKFKILQKYNRINLLVPVDAPHMWNAAMESKFCKLTVLGEHYRRLIEKGAI